MILHYLSRFLAIPPTRHRGRGVVRSDAREHAITKPSGIRKEGIKEGELDSRITMGYLLPAMTCALASSEMDSSLVIAA
jgi:hypothetical protein